MNTVQAHPKRPCFGRSRKGTATGFPQKASLHQTLVEALEATRDPVSGDTSRLGAVSKETVDTFCQAVFISIPMTQRNNHPQTAIARALAPAEVLHDALPLLIATATAALILVLVLITGPTSAGYGVA